MQEQFAGGIAISATLAAAFHKEIDKTVSLAVVLFLAALLLNLLSSWSEQWDTGSRLKSVRELDRRGAYGSRWQTWTGWFNYLAGIALLGAAGALGWFVLTTTM